MKQDEHNELSDIVNGIKHPNVSLQNDQVLWQLIEESMTRAHTHSTLAELRKDSLFGCHRMDISTYLWFAWPAIENAQDGADA
jgi:hypothetical protein